MFTVLLLHSSSDLYGASRMLCNTVALLLEEGYRCIVCLPERGPLLDELESYGIDVRINNLGILRRRYFTIWGIISRSFHLARASLRLCDIIRKERVDIVYSNTTAVLVGAIAAGITGRAHLWHVHEIILRPLPLAKFLAWAIRYLSQVTVAVSHEVKKHWDSFGTHGRNRIRVIYNGIDASRFTTGKVYRIHTELRLDKDTVIIGMIGRVHYWKGQDFFLEIAARVHSHYPSVRFVMIGDAYPGYEYLYDNLNEMKETLNLEGIVFDLGFRTDILGLLRDIDIFVLPSTLPDPLPTVVLEAMAACRPVVATAHGGALEMVADGETGYLIPYNDAEQAFLIMEPLICNHDLRVDMGTKGGERVRSLFSREAYKTKMLSTLRDLLPSQAICAH